MSPIRVLSILEAWFVTGQAKNSLDFALCSREERDGVPAIDLSLVTYERGEGAGQKNQFVIASRQAGVPVDLLTERGRYDTAVIGQLREIVAKRQPEIILTNNVKSHFLLRLSGLWHTHRWLAFHHGYTTTDFKMRCYNQLDRWSLRAPYRVVTVCGAFAEDMKRKGIPADRILVRHNSVGRFPGAGAAAMEKVRQGLPPGSPVLLVVGRLSHEKGHLDLLAALDYLRRQLKEEHFHAVLVGSGPEREKIEAARGRLNLESHVTLAGLQHDMNPYYAIADLVVIPSHSEGSPNVLLEAMSASVPVVASRVGGIPEIVTDGETALLVPPRDPEALAAAIRKMLLDAGLRKAMAQRALRLAENEYSLESYRRGVIGIFQKVLIPGR